MGIPTNGGAGHEEQIKIDAERDDRAFSEVRRMGARGPLRLSGGLLFREGRECEHIRSIEWGTRRRAE